MERTDRVRLHITPFNSSLLDRYIPASLKSQASNISFHSLETFPAKGFGYVELPTVDAQKLKAKLNGMTLKGSKVKIEEARPEKKRKSGADDEAVEEEKPRKKSKKEKKSKRSEGVLPGHELEEGRHVKRGWTEEPAGKSKTGKKEKEGKKMKFKTAVEENQAVVDGGKEKKDKKEKKEEKKKSKHGHKKEVVVTEFTKSTKLNFPNVKGERKDLTYEEGTGWIDREGNVIEAEPPSKKRKRSKVAREPAQAPVESPVPEPVLAAAVDEDESEEDTAMDSARDLSPTGDIASSDFSSSEEDESTVISFDESSDVDEETTRQLDQATSNALSNNAVTEAPSTALESVIPANTLSKPPESTDTTPPADLHPSKEIHPLEALFKRPAATLPPSESTTTPSFGFFSNAADDDDDEEEESISHPMQIDIPTASREISSTAPQTPHTKRDLEWRKIRSAAPTPDTAAIGKRFEFPPHYDDSYPGNEDDEEGEDGQERDGHHADEGVAAKEAAGRENESEFRQWFYQNRGDLNRAWKRRRKEERKGERQRENRRVGRRMA